LHGGSVIVQPVKHRAISWMSLSVYPPSTPSVLRWTLTGFVMMFLAYVGSRFVLEVVLHRV